MVVGAQPLQAPLRTDETGTVRVGNTRITLDLVVDQFEEGACPEEIILAYNTLSLEQVYLVLAYYLTHKEEVQAYLRRREEEAVAVRRQLEAEGISRPGVMAELRARLAARHKHAAPAE